MTRLKHRSTVQAKMDAELLANCSADDFQQAGKICDDAVEAFTMSLQWGLKVGAALARREAAAHGVTRVKRRRKVAPALSSSLFKDDSRTTTDATRLVIGKSGAIDGSEFYSFHGKGPVVPRSLTDILEPTPDA